MPNKTKLQTCFKMRTTVSMYKKPNCHTFTKGSKKNICIYRFGLHVNISRITIVDQRGIIFAKP